MGLANLKISYLDGVRFYNAFIAGGHALIKEKSYLNQINVFPVADADTGTNLVTTFNAIINKSQKYPSLKDTIQSISDSALMGARGNSGIIFAQFLVGLSKELGDACSITIDKFAESAIRAMTHVYDSISEPVEGTILTVMQAWSQAIKSYSSFSQDYIPVLTSAYSVAQEALKETPNQLALLKEAGVVDAGAQGFVSFLSGIMDFITSGTIKGLEQDIPRNNQEDILNHDLLDNTGYRYCTEAVISECKLDLKQFKARFKNHGSSLIIAGSKTKMHLHIHTDRPDEFFNEVKDIANIEDIKVDDMFRQFQINHKRKYSIGIVTDSACDLPRDIIEKYQIQEIAFGINFGKNLFLDKQTITSDNFYYLLEHDRNHPVSSQPSPKAIESIYEMMNNNYQHTFAIHISKELSGLYSSAKNLSKKFDKVEVINSKHLSGSLGLLVLRLAIEIDKGRDYFQIKADLPQWISKTKILTDINTLKYFVRGGRISTLKGFAAQMLNIKPIISLDENGKGIAIGKSHSRKQNMKTIISKITDFAEGGKVWNYAILHAKAPQRAKEYADKLTLILKKEPAFTLAISPVIGVHNGIGSVAVCIMLE